MQRFEGGSVYEHPDANWFPVRGAMIQALPDEDLFIPVSNETDAPASPYGTTGQMQLFLDERETSITGYYTEKWGTHTIAPEVEAYYQGLGGSASWLGFPVDRANLAADDLLYQKFEGDAIYQAYAREPIAVADLIDAFLTGTPALLSRLGWPKSEEKLIGLDGTELIQFFDNGVITVKDGKAKAWFSSLSLAIVTAQTPRQ
jgi:uncharacterized protein with LGFP repeats